MSVQVINLQGGAGGRPIVTFSDTLLSPDQPFLFGNDWNTILTGTSAGGGGTNLATLINRGVTGIILGSLALNANSIHIINYPALVNLGALRTRSGPGGNGIFAQATFVSATNGTDVQNGIGMLLNPNTNKCYYAGYSSNDSKVGIYGPDCDAGILMGASHAIAANDVVRIETIINAANTNVNIKLYFNGVLQETVNDASGSRVQAGGAWGMIQQASFNGLTIWKNFSAGVL
jgi:hypothetical protein